MNYSHVFFVMNSHELLTCVLCDEQSWTTHMCSLWWIVMNYSHVFFVMNSHELFKCVLGDEQSWTTHMCSLWWTVMNYSHVFFVMNSHELLTRVLGDEQSWTIQPCSWWWTVMNYSPVFLVMSWADAALARPWKHKREIEWHTKNKCETSNWKINNLSCEIKTKLLDSIEQHWNCIIFIFYHRANKV